MECFNLRSLYEHNTFNYSIECFAISCVRQVFDFIRCSEDDVALNELVKNNPYYQSMEEDAFDVAVSYTNATELIKVKDDYRKDGKVDMCTAITKLIQDGREEGIQEERTQGVRVLIKTCEEFKVSREDTLERIRNNFSLSDEKAEAFMEMFWRKGN